MFKNRSINLKFVKDMTPVEDTIEDRAKTLGEDLLTAQMYRRVAEGFVENATATIAGGVIAVAVVKTACVIAITIVKKFV